MEAYIAFFVFMLCYLPWTNRVVYKKYHLRTFKKKALKDAERNLSNAETTSKKTKQNFSDQLSSYIDLVAAVNEQFIFFKRCEEGDPRWFYKQHFLTMATIQMVILWYKTRGRREKDLLDWDDLLANYADVWKAVEESFVNCDQWNWSEMKEEDIE